MFGDQARHRRQRHELLHDRGSAAQVGNGFEQRDHHHFRRLGYSGFTFSAIRAQQAGFLLQQQDFQQVGHGLRVRNDVIADRPGAVALPHFAGGAQDRQFRNGLVGVRDIRRIQQARLGQFSQQQFDLLFFAELVVSAFHLGLGKQLSQHPLMDIGTLAHVERRQVEAENLGSALERRQARFDQRAAVVGA